MSRIVGVALFYDEGHETHLKRASTLCDSVWLWRASRWVIEDPDVKVPPKELAFRNVDPRVEALSDWLEDNGIATSIDRQQFDLVRAAMNAYLLAAFVPPNSIVMNLDDPFHDRLCRNFAAEARSYTDQLLVPVLRSSDLTSPSGETCRADLVRAVLEALPLPDDATPWEAIRDFRSDADAQAKYRRLRAWLNDMATRAQPGSQIVDRMATLIDDYNTYMRIHHQRFARSRLEVILCTAAEVTENIARLRLSDAVRALFQLKNAHETLLLAELQAPGREVAYVASARQVLGRGVL